MPQLGESLPCWGMQGGAVVPAAVTDVVVEAWGEEERGLEKEVPHWVFWAWILFGISSQETFAVVVVEGVGVAELESWAGHCWG